MAAPSVATTVTPSSKKVFAEDRGYRQYILQGGRQAVMEYLRASCHKHDTNHRVSDTDVKFGSTGRLHEGNEHTLKCGCSVDGHILDLLTFKV